MRMTNEEFQAEVYRRSAVYQRKQRRRMRIVKGASAFAGCLLLTLAAGAVLPQFLNAKQQATTAEMFTDGMLKADEPRHNEGVQQNDAADCMEDADTAYAPENGDAEKQDSIAEDATPPQEYDGPTVFVEKTEEELLAYYGLDALPEQIGGNMDLKRDRSKGFYYDTDPLGLTVAENDPGIVTNDHNTWFYQGYDPMRLAYISLFKWNYDDYEPSYTYPDDDPDSNTEYVVFSANGIVVQISYVFGTHEGLETLVEEVRDFLYEHKT